MVNFSQKTPNKVIWHYRCMPQHSGQPHGFLSQDRTSSSSRSLSGSSSYFNWTIVWLPGSINIQRVNLRNKCEIRMNFTHESDIWYLYKKKFIQILVISRCLKPKVFRRHLEGSCAKISRHGSWQYVCSFWIWRNVCIHQEFKTKRHLLLWVAWCQKKMIPEPVSVKSTIQRSQHFWYRTGYGFKYGLEDKDSLDWCEHPWSKNYVKLSMGSKTVT